MLTLSRLPGKSVRVGPVLLTFLDMERPVGLVASIRLRVEDGPAETVVTLERGQVLRLRPDVTVEFDRPRKKRAVLAIDAPASVRIIRAEIEHLPPTRGGVAC